MPDHITCTKALYDTSWVVLFEHFVMTKKLKNMVRNSAREVKVLIIIVGVVFVCGSRFQN